MLPRVISDAMVFGSDMDFNSFNCLESCGDLFSPCKYAIVQESTKLPSSRSTWRALNKRIFVDYRATDELKCPNLDPSLRFDEVIKIRFAQKILHGVLHDQHTLLGPFMVSLIV